MRPSIAIAALLVAPPAFALGQRTARPASVAARAFNWEGPPTEPEHRERLASAAKAAAVEAVVRTSIPDALGLSQTDRASRFTVVLDGERRTLTRVPRHAAVFDKQTGAAFKIRLDGDVRRIVANGTVSFVVGATDVRLADSDESLSLPLSAGATTSLPIGRDSTAALAAEGRNVLAARRLQWRVNVPSKSPTSVEEMRSVAAMTAKQAALRFIDPTAKLSSSALDARFAVEFGEEERQMGGTPPTAVVLDRQSGRRFWVRLEEGVASAKRRPPGIPYDVVATHMFEFNTAR